MTDTTTITAPRTRPRPPAPAGGRTGARAGAGNGAGTRSGTPPRRPARSGASRSAGGVGSAATAPAFAPGLPRREAPPARRPQLRIVESPAARRRRMLRTRRAVVSGTIVTVLAVFTIVAFHVMLAQGQVRLARLQTELSGAERDYQQARFAHAQAASPERIVALATQMGLVTPDRPPTAVGVPDPAAPSTTPSAASTLDGYASVKQSLADGP